MNEQFSRIIKISRADYNTLKEGGTVTKNGVSYSYDTTTLYLIVEPDLTISWSNVTDRPTRLSQFTDDLGSSPAHTHSQYLTSHQTLYTLTLNKNGTSIGTFKPTANSTINMTIDWTDVNNRQTTLSKFTDDLGTNPAHSHSQYALKAGDTFTGAMTFDSSATFNNSITADSIIAEDLIVNGAARFVSGLTSNSSITAPTFVGNLTGNADTASSCSGNSATATKLTSNAGASNIPVYFTGGVPSQITITAGSSDAEHQILVTSDTHKIYSVSGITANYAKGSLTATSFIGSLTGNASSASECSGNSATATKLKSAVTINGTSFDGSGNITTST